MDGLVVKKQLALLLILFFGVAVNPVWTQYIPPATQVSNSDSSITVSPNVGNVVVGLPDSGVSAATYTNATVTFNAKGIATSASSGTAVIVSSVTTVAGSGSGQYKWVMTQVGIVKEVTIVLDPALTDAGGTITFTVPFTQVPGIIGNTTTLTLATPSTTTFTLPATTTQGGVIVIKGI